jgi:Co/Zn/Cd efflux system component
LVTLASMADACCEVSDPNVRALRARHRGVLWAVLSINIALFAMELASGLWVGSNALLGDSLDMLGDALVYGASLLVVGRSAQAEARVAVGKGVLMALLAVGVVVDAVGRVSAGSPPASAVVGAVGALALAGNAVCFALLYAHRGDNLNLRSTWLCSRNDLIANLAVIASAAAVTVTRSPWPDALVGGGLALLWLRTSVRVLREAAPAARRATTAPRPATS